MLPFVRGVDLSGNDFKVSGRRAGSFLCPRGGSGPGPPTWGGAGRGARGAGPRREDSRGLLSGPARAGRPAGWAGVRALSARPRRQSGRLPAAGPVPAPPPGSGAIGAGHFPSGLPGCPPARGLGITLREAGRRGGRL